MEDIRLAARNYIKTADAEELDRFEDAIKVDDDPMTMHALWTDVVAHRTEDIQGAAVNEDLLMIQHVLKNWDRDAQLDEHDKDAAQAIYAWLADISLPSSEFASALEARYAGNKENGLNLPATLKAKQTTYALAISCTRYLHDILPILEVTSSVDVLTSLSSFTSSHDPWTMSTSLNGALAVFQSCMEFENRPRCWQVLERISETKIRPIFAKTKTPAITAAGRKNLHPLPQPRFDESLFDPESKPWKHKDVYATTVLEWILTQYSPSDINSLENKFHLYVPPILSLIDDESLSFKYRGCKLLIEFLTPIKASGSDILRRTNLSSVFDDALTPCLLSLPSITPEDEALHLFSVAYPALLLTLKARYHTDTSYHGRTAVKGDNKKTYMTRLVTLLRDSIISSFHHVSSYNPTSTNDGSSLAAFPYPRLSTFLLEQLRIVVQEIGIHTAKYLQELMPVIYGTLTNPFGTAHVPLLLAGVAAAQAVILNAHPRIWRFRGDLLAAICQCWINVSHDESNTNDSAQKNELRKVLSKLQGTVYLLKLSVQGAIDMGIENTGIEGGENLNAAGIVNGKDMDMERDVKALVEADEQLKDLLQADVDADSSGEYFFG